MKVNVSLFKALLICNKWQHPSKGNKKSLLYLLAQPNDMLELNQPTVEHCSLTLMSPLEESPAELTSGILSMVSPPVSEPSEGAPDTASVASSSAALGADTPATESGSTISSAPDVEKEGKKNKQHLYCPTCKVTVNSASQLEAHNSGKRPLHCLVLQRRWN